MPTDHGNTTRHRDEHGRFESERRSGMRDLIEVMRDQRDETRENFKEMRSAITKMADSLADLAGQHKVSEERHEQASQEIVQIKKDQYRMDSRLDIIEQQISEQRGKAAAVGKMVTIGIALFGATCTALFALLDHIKEWVA